MICELLMLTLYGDKNICFDFTVTNADWDVNKPLSHKDTRERHSIFREMGRPERWRICFIGWHLFTSSITLRHYIQLSPESETQKCHIL